MNYHEGAEFVRSSLARDQDVLIEFTALQQVLSYSPANSPSHNEWRKCCTSALALGVLSDMLRGATMPMPYACCHSLSYHPSAVKAACTSEGRIKVQIDDAFVMLSQG